MTRKKQNNQKAKGVKPEKMIPVREALDQMVDFVSLIIVNNDACKMLIKPYISSLPTIEDTMYAMRTIALAVIYNEELKEDLENDGDMQLVFYFADKIRNILNLDKYDGKTA